MPPIKFPIKTEIGNPTKPSIDFDEILPERRIRKHARDLGGAPGAEASGLEPSGAGDRIRYQNGTIYVSPDTQPAWVYGAIGERYNALGAAAAHGAAAARARDQRARCSPARTTNSGDAHALPTPVRSGLIDALLRSGRRGGCAQHALAASGTGELARPRGTDSRVFGTSALPDNRSWTSPLAISSPPRSSRLRPDQISYGGARCRATATAAQSAA